MPNISFAMTTPQVRNQTKTVTRRLGWRHIKLGITHQAIEKGQGLKKGDHVVVIGKIIPISTRWEPLQRLLDEPGYGGREVIREGFPDLTRAEFVEMLCKKYKCGPEKEFNRIEFIYPKASEAE